MTSAGTSSLLAAAVQNNAEWCDAVCRSHGLPGAFGDRVWRSPRRTPVYYPDSVTLRPDAVPGDVLLGIDASPGCSVKDSYAGLDLTPHGFTELFGAHWIHRAADLPAPGAPALRAERVRTAGGLRAWQDAWHGADGAPDVFRPTLLEDPEAVVIAFLDVDALAGGAVLYRGAGVVGVSNLFAAGGRDVAGAWSSVIAAAAGHFPGLPLVGYEHGDDLAPALDSGFTPIGDLRVWLRTG
ncbi:hypothetical protein [Streptomyces meridianus]|uniref:GNAT family N-acetyltransferase n=1 Tax=Streptomyces meridianus TaxID=2938945 RepID=A0ABT0X2R1_9ACTN|nr:hypothetical protein [Streptomyces meridianus]MCM2576831.1 hypothetical protein [Streptomyces meridianus]